MNGDTALVLLKFGGAMLIIMGLIFLAAVLTPKIAKLIEKRSGDPSPERVEEDILPENYTVKGPYDKSKLDDFDPNYKIYNTDIYGSESLDKLRNRKKASEDERKN